MTTEPAFVADKQGTESISVWDPFIRVAHWLLVAGFVAAYLTGDDESGAPDALHVWSGYVIGGLIALRIIWGVVGPRHARFADFVRGPRAVADYLLNLIHGRALRYLGHSPAGGAMIIALLLLLAGTVGTAWSPMASAVWALSPPPRVVCQYPGLPTSFAMKPAEVTKPMGVRARLRSYMVYSQTSRSFSLHCMS